MGVVSKINHYTKVIKYFAKMAFLGPAFMFLGVAGSGGGPPTINPNFLKKIENKRLTDLAQGINIVDHLTAWKEGAAIDNFRAVEAAIIKVRDSAADEAIKNLCRETLSVIRKNESQKAAVPELRPPIEKKVPEEPKVQPPPPPPDTGTFEIKEEKLLPSVPEAAKDYAQAFAWLAEIGEKPDTQKEMGALLFLVEMSNKILKREISGFSKDENRNLVKAYEKALAVITNKIFSKSLNPELKVLYTKSLVALFEANVDETRRANRLLAQALRSGSTEVILAALDAAWSLAAVDLKEEIFFLARLPKNLEELAVHPVNLEVIRTARKVLQGLSQHRNIEVSFGDYLDLNFEKINLKSKAESIHKELQKLGPEPTEEERNNRLIELAQELLKKYQKFLDSLKANGIQARAYVYRQKEEFQSVLKILLPYIQQLAETQDIYANPAKTLLRHLRRQEMAETILACPDEQERRKKISSFAEELEGKDAGKLADLVQAIAADKKIDIKGIGTEIREIFASFGKKAEEVAGEAVEVEVVTKEELDEAKKRIEQLEEELRNAKNQLALMQEERDEFFAGLGESLSGKTSPLTEAPTPEIDNNLIAAVRNTEVSLRRDPEIRNLLNEIQKLQNEKEDAEARLSLAQTAIKNVEEQKTAVVNIEKMIQEDLAARAAAALKKITDKQTELNQQRDELAEKKRQKEQDLKNEKKLLEMLTDNFEIAAQLILGRAKEIEASLANLKKERDEKIETARQNFVAKLPAGARFEEEKEKILNGETKLAVVDQIFKDYERRIGSLLKQAAEEFEVDISGKNSDEAMAVIFAAAQKAADAKRAEAKGAYPEREEEITSLSKTIEELQAKIDQVAKAVAQQTENLKTLTEALDALDAAKEAVRKANRKLEEILEKILG